MIGSTRAVQVWARRVPTDLRNGYNGLYGIVKREFDRDPLSGDAFLFVNKRRKSAKVLLWDGTGLCIYSKRLSRTERVYTLVTDEKQMYGCGHCGHAETALAPPQLVPGGRYGNSIAINVAVDKYVDHQPLNRQVSAMRRAGLRVSRQALWNQLNALAKLCEPSYEATPGCCASTRCCTPTRRPSA